MLFCLATANSLRMNDGMSVALDTVELASPAKVNLMLSVHGPQADGFHALTSVVVALDFGDQLKVARAHGTADTLSCTDPEVPIGLDNLVLKAARLFREAVGEAVYFEFDLEKSIPMGAGLGGGSSNASTALLGMNQLMGERLSKFELLKLAAELGSDCPFFIDPRPSLMSGRGEVIKPLDSSLAEVLRGLPIALFRPNYSINTHWAYGQLRRHAPASYESASDAQLRVQEFIKSQEPRVLLFNSFEPIVGYKYISLACLLELLREKGISALMSGSGSCCFSILNENICSFSRLHEICCDAWGDSAFWVVTSVS
ncbi:MAG TPA: 4-(cytidine 5'-diphospho)-2-C-methyl-D-erythritol kinase [Opitutae bacterium]|nr:4-(cytidine 5'-diphospho)-2-C-methyl-D-erythritol kinase [Opitutae bacterium]